MINVYFKDRKDPAKYPDYLLVDLIREKVTRKITHVETGRVIYQEGKPIDKYPLQFLEG